jgi:hypothetical protein
MTFPATLPPHQRRRHLADRRKVQELTARDRRNAVRRAAEDWMKL